MSADFKARLKNRESVIGSLVTLGSTDVAELMALVGFDYLWIDTEHAPLDAIQAQRMIQAVGGRCPCVVRVPENREVWIKRVLDTGCAGIVVPQVRTGEEARSTVRWSLYPPQGERSVGLSRAQGYGMRFDEYVREANETLSIVIQIEHVEAVKNIEEIVRVPGVDAVLIGPYDLSGSLGVPGQVAHAKVEAAMETVRKACASAGVAAGIFAADGASARRYIDAGYSLVAVGLDTFFLWRAAQRALEEARGG